MRLSADVLQETFLSVAKSISGFQPHQRGGGFRAWLATITRNKIVDLLRKRKQSQPAQGGSTMQQTLHDSHHRRQLGIGSVFVE